MDPLKQVALLVFVIACGGGAVVVYALCFIAGIFCAHHYSEWAEVIVIRPIQRAVLNARGHLSRVRVEIVQKSDAASHVCYASDDDDSSNSCNHSSSMSQTNSAEMEEAVAPESVSGTASVESAPRESSSSSTARLGAISPE